MRDVMNIRGHLYVMMLATTLTSRNYTVDDHYFEERLTRTTTELHMALNDTIKRHITILCDLQAKGGHNIYQTFLQFIADAAKADLVVPSDAQDIYEIWVDNSGRPSYSNNDYKQSNSYKVQVNKIRHIIERA
jgi:hypothetical protein